MGKYTDILLFLLLCSRLSFSQSDNRSYDRQPFILHSQEIDAHYAETLRVWLTEGTVELSAFFKDDLPRSFEVFLHSDRDSMDLKWQEEWSMPGFKSQCWMVASGVAHSLDILSPRVWETQACEHDAHDTIAVKKLVLHELVHVYHGQLNPSPDFADTEGLDWFIEGLAVYASGQLDEQRLAGVRELFRNDRGPEELSGIWKGRDRYGLAGSVVKYLDESYGREELKELLGFRRVNKLLEYLGISEDELLKAWQGSLSQSQGEY